MGERDMPVLTDFGAETDFELRLLGRDGTLKQRFDAPVPAGPNGVTISVQKCGPPPF